MKETGRSLYPCVCSHHRMGTALTLKRPLSTPVFVGSTAEDCLSWHIQQPRVHALFLNPALGAHHSQHRGEALSNSPAGIDGAALRAPVCAPGKADKSPAITPALKGLRQSLHSGPPEATSAWPMTMQHPQFLKEVPRKGPAGVITGCFLEELGIELAFSRKEDLKGRWEAVKVRGL